MLAGGIALLLALGIFGAISMLPDIPSQSTEAVAVMLLKTNPRQQPFERWLSAINALWHPGADWESGEAYSGAMHSDCRKHCEHALQIAFPHWDGLCEVQGDVVTVQFDSRGTLERWRIESGIDGC